MSVYVDDYEGRLGRMVMCHMLADSLDELHAFAARLGMRREWFQDGSAPHYDLSKSRRAEAIGLGAVHLPIRIDGKANPEWKRVYDSARKLKALVCSLCGETVRAGEAVSHPNGISKYHDGCYVIACEIVT